MKEYSDIYTENIEAARPFRAAYLDSVKQLILKEKAKREEERNAYISPEMLKNNREKYLSDFKKLLGSPLFERDAVPDFEKSFVASDSQCDIYRMRISPTEGINFSGLLFVPYNIYGKAPLILSLHGGEGTPELAADMYGPNYYSHMIRRLLDYGVVVFAPQLLLWDGKVFGSKFSRENTDANFRQLGGSITAFEAECIRSSIDCFEREEFSDFIDKEKIGIMGLSYGGYFSLITAALDERIKSVYSSCVFNDRIRYPRPDFAYFDMAKTFLDAETAALVAPRPLYIEASENDCFFRPDGAVNEYNRLKPYYEAYNAAQRLVFKLKKGGHTLDTDNDGIEFLINRLEK